MARAVGKKKKLGAGIASTRWGRFDVLVDLKHSELLLGSLHGGSRVRPEGFRHFKQMVYKRPRSFASGKGKRRGAWRPNDIEQRHGLLMASTEPQIVFMLPHWLSLKYLSLKQMLEMDGAILHCRNP
jgi:hypothetical protein